MSGNIAMTYKKDALLEALNALLPIARKQDAEAVKKHKADEKVFLQKFREACREALKWDYETAKNMHFSFRREAFSSYDRPTCPRRREDTVQRAIDLVTRSPAEKFRIHDSGQYAFIYRVLTEDVKQEKAVC
jgi:hypothetical protein